MFLGANGAANPGRSDHSHHPQKRVILKLIIFFKKKMCDSPTCQKEKVPGEITVRYSVLKIISRDREEAKETESEDSSKTTTAL